MTVHYTQYRRVSTFCQGPDIQNRTQYFETQTYFLNPFSFQFQVFTDIYTKFTAKIFLLSLIQKTLSWVHMQIQLIQTVH